ncbi:MAG: phosphatase PAP2 family protein [Gammaproteobacteria bacterium]|nr:phosphatase PAP2 family protein [Gammaproteobacteria bacterium]
MPAIFYATIKDISPMSFAMLKAPIRYLVISLPVVLVLLLISYFFIDKSLSVWVFQFGLHKAPGFSSDVDLIITQLVYCALLPTFAIYFYYQMQGHNSRLVRCLGLVCGSVSVAFFVKTSLQFLFGRYAPRYYQGKTLIFLQDPSRYGFHFLHGGGFPSGHMCVFTAALCAVCLYFPIYRWISGILLLLLAGCLIGANYHFLSDVIAGTYLGLSITLALYYLQLKRSV